MPAAARATGCSPAAACRVSVCKAAWPGRRRGGLLQRQLQQQIAEGEGVVPDSVSLCSDVGDRTRVDFAGGFGDFDDAEDERFALLGSSVKADSDVRDRVPKAGVALGSPQSGYGSVRPDVGPCGPMRLAACCPAGHSMEFAAPLQSELLLCDVCGASCATALLCVVCNFARCGECDKFLLHQHVPVEESSALEDALNDCEGSDEEAAEEEATEGAKSLIAQAYKRPGECWWPSANQALAMRRLLRHSGCPAGHCDDMLALWASGRLAKQAVEATARGWQCFLRGAHEREQ